MFGNSSADPIQTMEIRYDRDKPSRAVTLPYFPGQDKTEVMPMWNNAVNKAQQWQESSAGRQDYSQSGNSIPNFSAGSGGAFASGSDFPGQGFGYQYQSPAIAQGLPVGQDPNFRDGPMSQEDFSEMVNYGLDLKHGPRFRTAPAAAPVGPQLPRFFKPV
jgi:hypothetical protein